MKRLVPLTFTIFILFLPFYSFSVGTPINKWVNSVQVTDQQSYNTLAKQLIKTPLLNSTFSKGNEITSSKLSLFIEDNLTLLYTISVILVLINLAVQIKIIFQMVHLFFLFRKKEEVLNLKFS